MLFFFFFPKRKKTYKAINKSMNLGKHWPNLQSIKLIFKSGKIRFFFFFGETVEVPFCAGSLFEKY